MNELFMFTIRVIHTLIGKNKMTKIMHVISESDMYKFKGNKKIIVDSSSHQVCRSGGEK